MNATTTNQNAARKYSIHVLGVPTGLTIMYTMKRIIQQNKSPLECFIVLGPCNQCKHDDHILGTGI